MAMSEAILELREIQKRFGTTPAVDGLSFRVPPGEIFGLLGANGAGKTTTIQLLLGLTTPTSGEARVLGMDVRRERRRILARVNFSTAYVALPSNLTVRQNLSIFARLYGLDRREGERRIESLLGLFEVQGTADRKTGALSSGQQTRINLCKAFLNDPEVLFLDEPTASLDPDIADKVRQALLRIQRERGATIVYTSHNMTEVEKMYNRVLFLARGRAVTQGTPAEVMARAQRGSLEEVFIAIARDGELSDTGRSGEDA